MRVAIIGSRKHHTKEIGVFLPEKVDLIISGGAEGIDCDAKEYAKRMNIPYMEFLPDYAKYGKAAPLVRNRMIVENCDCVIAFWDGKSKGTHYSIRYAEKIGKSVRIIPIS